MNKYIKYGFIGFIALVISLLVATCQKEEIMPQMASNEVSEVARMISYPTTRMLYLNDYKNSIISHIGDTAWENKKIKYLVSKSFNKVAVYNIDGVSSLTGSNGTRIRSFVSRLHANNIKVDVVFSNASFCTSTLNTYQNGSTVSQRFDGIRWENEYYHNAGYFGAFKSQLPVAYNWAKAQNPKLTVSWYGSWLSTDYSWNYQFKELIKYNDVIVFHDYRVAPQWSYMKPRADSAAKAYKDLITSGIKTQGSKLSSGAIASAESSFSGPYFGSHTYINFYTDVYNQHNTSLLVNENFIDITEIDVFADSQYSIIQP